jgi:hypothetical protein
MNSIQIKLDWDLVEFNSNSIKFRFDWIQLKIKKMQISARRYSNLFVIFIVCDYGVRGKKKLWKNVDLKKYITILFKKNSKKIFIWIWQNLLTLKLPPYTNFNVTIVTGGILRNNKFSMD